MIFYILPVLFVSISPWLNDATTILRGAIIGIIPIFYLLFRDIKFSQFKVEMVLFIIIICGFGLSFLINKQSYAHFLYGPYGRGLGVLALLGLFLLFILSATEFNLHKRAFINTLQITSLLSIIYGSLQAYSLDIFNWDDKYTGSVILTTGNPNFASALLGLLSCYLMFLIYISKLSIKIYSLALYFMLLFLILRTNSSQGWVILLFTNLILLLSLSKLKSKSSFNFGLIAIVLLILVAVTSLTFMNARKIDQIINFSDRIRHWRLAINMIQDNLLIGVGLGEFQTHASAYVSKEEARYWGDFLAPDRAHNVVLDFFASGGLIVGLIYTIFLLLISYYAIVIMKKNRNDKIFDKKDPIILLPPIWFGYLIQILISPSSLLIDAVGYITGGAILGTYILYKGNVKNV